jgi:hypothetical protein
LSSSQSPLLVLLRADLDLHHNQARLIPWYLVPTNNKDCKYEVEERRGKVGSMLSQSMTEAEIASQLGVDQSTKT